MDKIEELEEIEEELGNIEVCKKCKEEINEEFIMPDGICLSCWNKKRPISK